MTTFFNPLRPDLNGTASDAIESAEIMPAETPIAAPHTLDNAIAKRVNMRDYGFEQSGVHRGDAKALANLFRQILSGRLIDENTNLEQQQEHQARIGEQIADLEKQSEEVLSRQRRITEVEIPQAEAEIRSLEDEIHEIRVDEAAGRYNPDQMNRFALWKYGIMTVLGLLYVVCFYISAVYSGLIRNIGAAAQNTEGESNLRILFSNVFVKEAYSELDFHWVAPILLLMFAIVLDFLWDQLQGRKRIVAMVVVALLVFVLDALIAFKIEDVCFQIKKMTGTEDPNHYWLSSADFWIVVVMGFVATLAWGVVLYAFKQELAKVDPRRMVTLEVARRQGLKAAVTKLIFTLKGEMQDLEGKLGQLYLAIKHLREKQRTLRVSLAELEKSVSDFYDGWLAYLNSRGNCEPVKQSCAEVMTAFSDAHLRSEIPAFITQPVADSKP